MPINKKLLRRVRNHILAEPRRYNQYVVGQASDDAPCGTAACLMGWAAVLGGVVTAEEVRDAGPCDYLKIFPATRDALGLSKSESDIMSSRTGLLWPEPFSTMFRVAYAGRDKEGQARAAADYINYILRTGKVG